MQHHSSFLCLALAIAATTNAPGAEALPSGGYWQLTELIILPPDVDSGGTFQGSYAVRADASGMSGEAHATDILDLHEELYSATALGYGRQAWRYIPILDETGEVEFDFYLAIDGFIDLIDGPCYGVIVGSVQFASSLDGPNGGPTNESVDASFARATGSGSSVELSIPVTGGLTTLIAASTGEGHYPLPAQVPKYFNGDQCVDEYWMMHASSVYIEAWANGWIVGPFFNWAEVKLEIRGEVISHWLRRVCP
ncbi:MAG: hypothetical protein GY711_09110 [bacterium]|nr:hypothetical protein [bacterium]